MLLHYLYAEVRLYPTLFEKKLQNSCFYDFKINYLTRFKFLFEFSIILLNMEWLLLCVCFKKTTFLKEGKDF